MRLLAIRYLGICGCVAIWGGCGARTRLEQWGQQATPSGATASAGVSNGTAGERAGTGGLHTGKGPSEVASSGAAGGSGGTGGSGGIGGSGGAGAGSDGVTEICNGLDDDGDGEIDEDLPFAVVEGPVALRTDEGRTDNDAAYCSSCAWAWDPQLVMPGDELGVVWYLGIHGGREQPSSFFRRLSWELTPRDVVRSLSDRYLMGTLGRGQTRTGAELLVFTERRGAKDLPSYALLGGGFQLGASITLDGCDAVSAARTLSVLWPGLIGCANFGHFHTFLLANDDGGVRLHVDHALSPVADFRVTNAGRAFGALNGASGLLAMPLSLGGSKVPNQLWTQPISARGEALGEPLQQALDAPLFLELEGLFSVPGGYLLFGANRSLSGPWPQGRFTLALDLDGRARGDLTHYDLDLADGDALATLRVGSGFVLAAVTARGLRVEQLDASGAIVGDWLQELPIHQRTPSLLFARGQLYVAFAEPPPLEGGANRVMALRFGCARLH
ncbi:MAG TPA: hypothetical protein VFK05_00255 [Polyangiaceae bacterium]|nr:hypothetical protein [Polyangiaceae bacterium]